MGEFSNRQSLNAAYMCLCLQIHFLLLLLLFVLKEEVIFKELNVDNCRMRFHISLPFWQLSVFHDYFENIHNGFSMSG